MTLTHCRSACCGIGMCLQGTDQMALDTLIGKNEETTVGADRLHVGSLPQPGTEAITRSSFSSVPRGNWHSFWGPATAPTTPGLWAVPRADPGCSTEHLSPLGKTKLRVACGCLCRGKEEQGSKSGKETHSILEPFALCENFCQVTGFPCLKYIDSFSKCFNHPSPPPTSRNLPCG